MEGEIPKERRKEYKQAFQMFDKNKDGFITFNELSNVMKSLNLDPTEEELNEMINEVDLDGNGEIDFEEFISLMNRRSKETDIEDEVLSAFKLFDKEGSSGLISVTDLRHILKEFDSSYSDEELNDVLLAADEDMDGFLNYKEIISALFEQKLFASKEEKDSNKEDK